MILILINVIYLFSAKIIHIDSIYKESQNLKFFHSEVDKYIFLLSIIEIESNFNPTSVSKKKAIGLMQILPSTAEWIAKKNNIKKYNLFEPNDNLKIGVIYLNFLWDQFNDINKVVIAYNMGHNAVKKGRLNYKYLNKFIKKYLYYKELFYGSSVFIKRKY